MIDIMIDVESDGPAPGLFSMISFGAIIVDDTLDKTFYGEMKPISENYIEDALAVSGFTREETLAFEDPATIMTDFNNWIKLHRGSDRVTFWSDNNGYDFSFINYYFHLCIGENPFGWSSQNLGSFYKGIVRNRRRNFKHLRKTKHTHHPVDDAKGNAEALLQIFSKYGIK